MGRDPFAEASERVLFSLGGFGGAQDGAKFWDGWMELDCAGLWDGWRWTVLEMKICCSGYALGLAWLGWVVLSCHGFARFPRPTPTLRWQSTPGLGLVVLLWRQGKA